MYEGKSSPGDTTLSQALQCQAGRSVSPSEVDCYAGRATQASQVPTKESEEVCPTATRQEGLFGSTTPNLGLVAGGLITHICETTTQVEKPKKDSHTTHNVK
jgi:hypothetical protein